MRATRAWRAIGIAIGLRYSQPMMRVRDDHCDARPPSCGVVLRRIGGARSTFIILEFLNFHCPYYF